MQNYIVQLLNVVEQEIKGGKSKEDILKITSIPNVGEWTDELKRIQSNLEAAYSEFV